MNDFVIETEKKILALILQDPDRYFDLAELKWFMLSYEPYRIIFKAFESCVENKEFPDKNTILNHIFLESKKKEDLDVFSSYIDKLLAEKDLDFNIRDYENIVISQYKAKEAVFLASSLINDIKSTSDPIGTIYQYAKKFESLALTGNSDNVSDFNSVLKLAWDNLVSKLSNQGINGYTTGLPSLDKVTDGVNPGELWVIAGRPGMGKSALFCNMALKQALADIPVCYVSLEMRNINVAQRMISIYTGIPHEKIRFGTLSQEELDKIADAIRVLKSFPIYIDSNFQADDKYFFSLIKKMARKNKVKVVILDYLQLLSQRDAEATQELGRITRMAKLLANDLGIGIVIGSQLNRLVETRSDKHPILSDLRQSGYIEEDADIVLGLYRDIKYNQRSKTPDLLEILLLKQREGPIGMLPARFDEKTYRIEDYV
jgi:replicative DNA helicase